MEKSKYYTPEIEEFCVGFECEFKSYDKNNKEQWDKRVIGIHSFQESSYEQIDYKSNWRVKYLDGQDIESLGWKLNTDLYIRNNITLQVHKDSITIKYYDNFNNDSRTHVEQINIKTKDEFITLLKQLRIG